VRYAYRRPSSGEVVWHNQAVAEGWPPEKITVEGEGCPRDRRAEMHGGTPTKGWPLACYASGVHPDQAQDLRDEFKRVGVPTEVNHDGDPVYTSPTHRRKALKARGFFDRASYL